MESQAWEVVAYTTEDGAAPFDEWINQLKDKKGKSIILARLSRLMNGNLGDHKFLAEGVFELRVQFGPGYRVYFARQDNQIILLLCGGDKRSQAKDIQSAIGYWQDYRRRLNE